MPQRLPRESAGGRGDGSTLGHPWSGAAWLCPQASTGHGLCTTGSGRGGNQLLESGLVLLLLNVIILDKNQIKRRGWGEAEAGGAGPGEAKCSAGLAEQALWCGPGQTPEPSPFPEGPGGGRDYREASRQPGSSREGRGAGPLQADGSCPPPGTLCCQPSRGAACEVTPMRDGSRYKSWNPSSDTSKLGDLGQTTSALPVLVSPSAPRRRARMNDGQGAESLLHGNPPSLHSPCER